MTTIGALEQGQDDYYVDSKWLIVNVMGQKKGCNGMGMQ